MVRKIICFVCSLGLIAAILCGPVQAATHSVYDEGTLSTTYTTYFKDIISGAKFTDNYVAFRSSQYEYNLVVGELEYNNGVISLVGDICKEYRFYSTSTNYNSQYRYSVDTLSEFSLNTDNYILYSDVGDFPQLVERGAKYEMFTTLLLCIVLLCIVFGRFFRKR